MWKKRTDFFQIKQHMSNLAGTLQLTSLRKPTLISSAFKDGIISKMESSFLPKPFYQTPYFYHLPKIHKNLDHLPSRPIVAAMDSITTSFSLYIDQFLQPIEHQLQSYIHDGTHLLEPLSPYRWEPTYVWLSLDVNSLYTYIPHSFGLMALEQFLVMDPIINPRQASPWRQQNFVWRIIISPLTEITTCNNKARQ